MSLSYGRQIQASISLKIPVCFLKLQISPQNSLKLQKCPSKPKAKRQQSAGLFWSTFPNNSKLVLTECLAVMSNKSRQAFTHVVDVRIE